MEKMNEALEELKRVDHLIYVSLKYTRTVDVIINILNRMVDAYSFIVDAMIINATEQDKISTEPESAIERAEAVRSIYRNDDLITDNIGLYILLRKLLRARYIERENEYRRHVTMKTVIDGREEIVNIDIITNYYLFQREFIIHVKNILDGNIEIELEDREMGMPPEPEWMHEPEESPVLETKKTTKISTRTPPTKQQVKVRPITSAPRKRTPRPKKYKIQVPKEENAIMRPPFEHDPKYNPELRERLAKEKRDAEASKKRAVRKKTVKKVVKKVVRKRSTRKKVARKKASKKPKRVVKRVVRKKTVKKVVKKVVRKRSTRKKVVKKKVVKKSSKKKTAKKPVKTTRKKVTKAPKKRSIVKKFSRAVKKVVRR